MYVLYCATLSDTYRLSLSNLNSIDIHKTLWPLTRQHTHKYANMYVETQRPGNLLMMCLAKSCSFPFGATIIEGWIWTAAAHKWFGWSWFVLELNLNIMTGMMKLTQNHQLARAEIDPGLAYLAWRMFDASCCMKVKLSVYLHFVLHKFCMCESLKRCVNFFLMCESRLHQAAGSTDQWDSQHRLEL